MSDPYEYTDPEGSTFVIYPWPRDDREGATISWGQAHDGALIPPDRIAEVVAALYRAVGRPAPIVLERLNWHGTDRTRHTLNGVTVRRDGQRIAVLGQVITATTARMLARALAEMAEDAENEPDPAEVERLAAFLSEEYLDTSPEGLARRVLRRFKVEERAQ
jgi:hypothetical protein